MATQNTIGIGVVISDNGTAKKTIKNVEELHSTIKKTQTTAEKGVNLGGTAGSRKAASAGYRPGGAVQAASAPTGSEEHKQYGQMRGSAGATGASARDFANQAQGLGGLVRLYATLAANMFAAGAAFRALSNAMDTSNMVKGLDQLGAASGKALGTLSKRLAQTTGNAISMREAMEATVKASSSGMNSEQILKMGQVAKQASLALGVDMSDAISRISRGITKLEPELLDEIGLFTKTGKAAEDYAKRVGKTVSELSDFERRQAFANAVLEEGTKKFGSINLDSNPYTQLLASLKDLAQTGLEVLNKVISPIVGFLSKSPEALSVTIGALAAVLLKQAIPALGEFKTSLQASAETSLAVSQEKALEALAVRDKLTALELQRLEESADAKLAIVEKTEAEAVKAQFAGMKQSKAVQALLSKDIMDLREEDYNNAIAHAKKLEQHAASRRGSSRTSDQTRATNLENEAKLTRNLVKELGDQQKAEIALADAKAKIPGLIDKASKGYGVFGQTVKGAYAAEVASKKNAIVSNAAYNASLIGLRGSFSLMKADIEASNLALGKMGTMALYARGAIGILTGAIAAFGASIAAALNIVGLVVAAFAALDALFSTSKTDKAVSQFSSSVDAAESAVSTLSSTYAQLNSDTITSVKGLEAQASALQEISLSFGKLRTDAIAANAAIDSGSWWDKTKEWVKDSVGFGIKDQFQKSFAKGIIDSLSGISGTNVGAKAKSELAKILKLDPKSLTFTKDLKKALDSLDPASSAASQVEKVFADIGTSASIGASKSREFEESLQAVSTAAKDMSDKFKVNDPLVNFATASITAITKLEDKLSGPVEGYVANLLSMSQQLQKTPIFGPELSGNLAKYTQELEKLNREYAEQFEQRKNLAQLSDTVQNIDVNALTADISKAQGINWLDAAKVAKEYKDAVTAAYTGAVAATDAAIKKSESSIRSIADVFKAAIPEGLKNQVQQTAIRMQAAIAEGSTKFLQGIFAALSAEGFVGMSDIETRLKQQEIGLQASAIQTQRDLIKAVTLNTIASTVLTSQQKLATAQKDYEMKASPGSAATAQEKQAAALAFTAASREALAAVETEKRLRQAVKDPVGALRGLARTSAETGQTGIETVGSTNTALIQDFAQTMAGFVKQLGDLGLQSRQESLSGKLKSVDEKFIAARKDAEIEGSALANEVELFNNTKERGALTAMQALREEQRLNIAKSNVEINKQALQLGQDYEKQILYANELASSGYQKEAEATKARAESLFITKSTALIKARELVVSNEGVAAEKKALDIRTQELNRVSQIEKKQREITNTLEDTRASTAAILLDTAKQTEAYTGEYLQALETEKSLRETLTTAQRAQAEETAAFDLARKTDLEELALLELNGATGLATRLRTDMAQAQSMHEAKLAQIEEEKQARLRSIEEVAAYREERENFSQMIESVKGLDSVWAGVGTSIAAVMTAQDEMATSHNQYSKELEALHTKLRGLEEGSLDYKKTTQDITKTQEKQQKSEITGYAKTVGAAKSMFKEKTTAHKALAAVEKVLHVQRLAMDLKEMVQKLFTDGAEVTSTIAAETAKTGATSAGFLARTGTYISEIFAKFTASMGPWGWAAAAAVVAAIFGGGSGKSKAAFVPSAEQRQETQGTAMSWDNQGNKVQTSRGVFGDTDAKSESIANSLERIKETSVDGLRYDNKMVDLLSKINDGINNTAKSLYSIRGLRQGSLFDTREGTTKGKGLLGTGLFGSKTSTNITDSGVLINATFADLASTTSQAAIQFYEDVTITKKKWYGSSKTSYRRNLETADQITQDYFNDIFSNATELFKEIGQDAGMQVEQVLSSLSGVSFANLSISLRGLKGEDLEKELNAVISSMLDQGAEAVFSQFMQFEEFGEGMLETVIRVTDNNRKVKQALSNLGIGTLRNVIGMASYEITEALVEAAGGIQDFLAKAEDYREKFLTEAERLAPIQLEVTAEIARIAKLGFTSADGLVDTRQEFKALVSSLDLTSETGRTAYTALMEVAEGFHQVTEATDTALQSTIDKFKKFADDLRAFRDNLVLGSSSILTPLQKYAESKLQFEKTYAQALAGDEVAQGKLTNSAQAFLTASKDYFASSSQYTQDFNSVLDKVGAGIAGAETQLSIAERQLNGITEQIGLLTTINENIAYIAGVPQAATGGRVHGLTLVGERGPELVDFTNPGMVYPADQTRGMFAPQPSMSNNIYQVVAELRQVKQELAQLRQEQQQQTGDLIVSNYDANNRAAETISAEVALTTTQKEWRERNAPAVV